MKLNSLDRNYVDIDIKSKLRSTVKSKIENKYLFIHDTYWIHREYLHYVKIYKRISIEYEQEIIKWRESN